MASATKKALWLCTFLAEVLGSLDHLLAAGTFILGFPMALAKNDRTKHMAVRHNFIRDELEEGRAPCRVYADRGPGRRRLEEGASS